MIKPFHGEYILTQGFGLNPADYARFGLKGHNGIDWGLPTGTQIIAPHGGKVIEVYNDIGGYGNYIKIDNDKEGSVLAHLQSFQVKVGDAVSEGQPIALSNNTGNSTGPHLHWGHYFFPRNRNNGFNGYADQLPFLKSTVDTNMYKGLNLADPESMKVAVDVWFRLKNKELIEKITYDKDIKTKEDMIVDLRNTLAVDKLAIDRIASIIKEVTR